MLEEPETKRRKGWNGNVKLSASLLHFCEIREISIVKSGKECYNIQNKF